MSIRWPSPPPFRLVPSVVLKLIAVGSPVVNCAIPDRFHPANTYRKIAFLGSTVVPLGTRYTKLTTRLWVWKRPAFFGRRSLKRVETNKIQFRDCVVSTGQHSLITSRLNACKSVANRVRSGSTGVGNHLARRRNSESLLRVNHRFLRRIIRKPAGGVPRRIVSMQ